MNLSNMTAIELLNLRDEATQQMHQRARLKLEESAEFYIETFGPKIGMEKLAEDLLQVIAPKTYPEKWSGLVSYINKISG